MSELTIGTVVPFDDIPRHPWDVVFRFCDREACMMRVSTSHHEPKFGVHITTRDGKVVGESYALVKTNLPVEIVALLPVVGQQYALRVLLGTRIVFRRAVNLLGGFFVLDEAARVGALQLPVRRAELNEGIWRAAGEPDLTMGVTEIVEVLGNIRRFQPLPT